MPSKRPATDHRASLTFSARIPTKSVGASPAKNHITRDVVDYLGASVAGRRRHEISPGTAVRYPALCWEAWNPWNSDAPVAV